MKTFEINTIRKYIDLPPTNSKQDQARTAILNSKSRLTQAQRIARAILSSDAMLTEAGLVELIVPLL